MKKYEMPKVTLIPVTSEDVLTLSNVAKSESGAGEIYGYSDLV